MNKKEKRVEWLSNEIARQPNDKELSGVKNILEHSTTPNNIAPDSNAKILLYLID